MRARRIARAVLATLLVATGIAHADPPPPASITFAYSSYELETIDAALKQLHRARELEPEGKIIEAIDIVALEVIEARDPMPRALNAVHVTSRDYVIQRELLVSPGEPYRGVLVDESARNLRNLPQLSLVVCFAAKGQDANHVRLVVVTKDVWSLLVDFDLSVGSGGLYSLDLEPKEKNLFGTQNTVLARFTMLPLSYSLGGAYLVPRLDGTRLSLQTDANVVMNKESGDVEGTFGTVTVSRPLYSARIPWAFFTGIAWNDQVFRRYVNAQVDQYNGVPYAYRSRVIADEISVTRSFGWANKNDISFGAEAEKKEFRAPDPASTVALASQIPVSETRVGPFAEWHAYGNSYLRAVDVETLGLQEDFALGHDIVVRAYPVLAGLGSSRTFLGVYGGVAYTWALRDGYATASITSTTEGNADGLTDASVGGGFRIVTPRLGFGRLVFDATGLDRYDNYTNARSFLGGDTRLRGWPSNYFAGKNVVSANLEYRTAAIRFTSIHIGAAAFYDAGDAFDDVLRPKHSVGVGLRALFPQIDRVVFRFDLGFPIVAGPLPSDVSPASFFFSFHQAFNGPTVRDNPTAGATSLTPTIGGALGD